MPQKAVVLLSGGVDSSTLLYHMLADGWEVTALTVNYGQRHKVEIYAAKAVAHSAGSPWVHIALDGALRQVFAGAESSQVGQLVDVPAGHYAAEPMKRTIVPNRNMILLAVAGALAVSTGAQVIGYAAHAGDHPIYPDCRPEFADRMGEALLLGNDPGIGLLRPFIRLTKTDIVRQGAALQVPFMLTYSCYAGQAYHCGVCGTCVERKEAFRDAGTVDPTAYEA